VKTRRGGWVPVPRGNPVALLEPVHVKRWGYEVDRDTVFAKLIEEAQALTVGTLSGVERSGPHLFIAQHHPKFKTYWEKMAPAVQGAISSLHEIRDGEGWLDFEAEEKLIHDVHFKVVEKYVHQIVKERTWKTQERKLWTENFAGSPLASGAWRGPWSVLYKRVVKTGTYYPATGGSEDCDPACLAAEKTHVLLWVERQVWNAPMSRRDEDALVGQFIVERTNTIEWSQQRVADILMETT
jgi:hypothetical protein